MRIDFADERQDRRRIRRGAETQANAPANAAPALDPALDLQAGRAVPPAAESIAAPASTTPVCKRCDSQLGTVLRGRFGEYFHCRCGANTSIPLACDPAAPAATIEPAATPAYQ